MPKFSVTIARTVIREATVYVTARDKRSAAMVAGRLLDDSAEDNWKAVGVGDEKIKSIDKIVAPPSADTTGSRRGRQAA